MFANLLNVWLNRRQPDSQTCFCVLLVWRQRACDLWKTGQGTRLKRTSNISGRFWKQFWSYRPPERWHLKGVRNPLCLQVILEELQQKPNLFAVHSFTYFLKSQERVSSSPVVLRHPKNEVNGHSDQAGSGSMQLGPPDAQFAGLLLLNIFGKNASDFH